MHNRSSKTRAAEIHGECIAGDHICAAAGLPHLDVHEGPGISERASHISVKT